MPDETGTTPLMVIAIFLPPRILALQDFTKTDPALFDR